MQICKMQKIQGDAVGTYTARRKIKKLKYANMQNAKIQGDAVGI